MTADHFTKPTSDKFIHNAPIDAIAESVLRATGSNRQTWINMFIVVYGEQPNLNQISKDIQLVTDDDDDDADKLIAYSPMKTHFILNGFVYIYLFNFFFCHFDGK